MINSHDFNPIIPFESLMVKSYCHTIPRTLAFSSANFEAFSSAASRARSLASLSASACGTGKVALEMVRNGCDSATNKLKPLH